VIQANCAARLAAAHENNHSREHFDSRNGKYSCTTICLLLAARNYLADQLNNAQLLTPFEAIERDINDFQPAQLRVIGLIIHFREHYIAYRRDGERILELNSTYGKPRVISTEQMMIFLQTQGVRVFQITEPIDDFKVHVDLFSEYNALLAVDDIDDPDLTRQLMVYRAFCETLNIPVSE